MNASSVSSPSTPTLAMKIWGGECEFNLFASVTKSSCTSHLFLCSFPSTRKPNQFLRSFTQETGLDSRRVQGEGSILEKVVCLYWPLPGFACCVFLYTVWHDAENTYLVLFL